MKGRGGSGPTVPPQGGRMAPLHGLVDDRSSNGTKEELDPASSWNRFATEGRRSMAGHEEPGLPPRGASARREFDRVGWQTASDDQPRDDGVRVPHLAGARLVS